MSHAPVAKRYAEALYEAASDASAVETVDADVDLIRESIEASGELRLFFQSPVISREKKTKIAHVLFKARLSPTSMRFVELLIDKQREDIIDEVLGAYRSLRDDMLGIARATARTAQLLADDDEGVVRSALAEVTGQKIQLSTEVDRSLIGGMVVQIGDTVYDGSVRHKLQHLRAQFRSGSFRSN